MNVLITGVAGFLGSHLAEHHLKKGDVVWGLDDFSTALGRTAPHFISLKKHHDFRFFEEDVTDWITIQEWKQVGLNLIYNFACPASPPRYQAMPVKTLLTSVVGTRNMLEIARVHNAVLVQASTSEVYGDPKVSPQREDYVGNVNSYGPRSCYDEGKRAAEALCFDYLHNHNTDARLVRIFNTYGPHMDPDDGRVVTNFVKQALKGEKLTVYGNGRQTRSFCYVTDLIDGITRLAALPKNPQTPVNIGNPVEYSMKDLATVVLDTVHGADRGDRDLRGPHMIEYRDLPVDDPMQRRPDIRLAQRILGWEPTVELEEGIKHMVNYMKETLTPVSVDPRLV